MSATVFDQHYVVAKFDVSDERDKPHCGRPELMAYLEAHGIDPKHVRGFVIRPEYIEVVAYAVNHTGQRYLDTTRLLDNTAAVQPPYLVTRDKNVPIPDFLTGFR